MILAFSAITNAQICGQLFKYDSEYAAAKVSIEGQSIFTQADFDGNFKLETPERTKKINLIIDLNQGFPEIVFPELKIIIKNLELTDSTLIDLKKINLPDYKNLSIEEYKELNAIERKQCRPIYHWAQLLGYEYSNRLEEKFILITCNSENPITEFEFDKVNKHVILEWNNLKTCE